MIFRVFEACDRAWRGIGVIPSSGYRLRAEFARFDASSRFSTRAASSRASPRCASRGWCCRARRSRTTVPRSAPPARPQSAGCDHGLGRRRVRGLLQLRKAPGLVTRFLALLPAARDGPQDRGARPRQRRQAQRAAHPRAVPAGVRQSAAGPARRPGGARRRRRAHRLHHGLLRGHAAVFPRRRYRQTGRPRHHQRPRHVRRARRWR